MEEREPVVAKLVIRVRYHPTPLVGYWWEITGLPTYGQEDAPDALHCSGVWASAHEAAADAGITLAGILTRNAAAGLLPESEWAA